MILADQCVFELTIRELEREGIPITRLRHIARPDLPDPDVLSLAIERDEILLTEDKDFCNILRYPPSDHTGIIVLRGVAVDEEAVRATLLTLLHTHPRDEMRGKLFVVDAVKIRTRLG
jgi:predicted nuclease of predicted toxin-antitoxin system